MSKTVTELDPATGKLVSGAVKGHKRTREIPWTVYDTRWKRAWRAMVG